MGIYTRKGDGGMSDLRGEFRLPKDDPLFEVLGTLDEAASLLGIARALCHDEEIDEILRGLQRRLMDVSADLAAGTETHLPPSAVEELEALIDRLSARLPPQTAFILPAGGPAAAHLHLARAVVRRAERRFWALAEEDRLEERCAPWLNRLSDALFVLARRAAHLDGHRDEPWHGDWED